MSIRIDRVTPLSRVVGGDQLPIRAELDSGSDRKPSYRDIYVAQNISSSYQRLLGFGGVPELQDNRDRAKTVEDLASRPKKTVPDKIVC